MWSHLPILAFMVVRDVWGDVCRRPEWWTVALLVVDDREGIAYLPRAA